MVLLLVKLLGQVSWQATQDGCSPAETGRGAGKQLPDTQEHQACTDAERPRIYSAYRIHAEALYTDADLHP